MPGARRGVFRTQSGGSVPKLRPEPSPSTPPSLPSQSQSSGNTSPTGTSPSSTSGPNVQSSSASVGGADFDGINTIPTAICLQLKHAHVADISLDSNLLFEAMLFVFCVMALGMQFINLYKTVWWLPHSNAKYALNFYLIDPYLSLVLVLILSRRLIYCFIMEVNISRNKSSILFWFLQLLKLCMLVAVSCLFLFAAFHLFLENSLLDCLFLCYPLVSYIILFSFNLQPLFGQLSRTPSSDRNSTASPKHRQKAETSHSDIPLHLCSTCPETVRYEVEALKTDFNSRMKEVLFSSMLCAYYVGFVPLWFAQNTLYYDTWWVSQHVGLVWVCCFVLFMVQLLPAKYVDVLHRCSLHLGHWVKVEGRHAHVPYNAWSELQVWQHGSLVKHVRGLFKAEGIHNAAEPGNSMHNRFYFVFHRPLRVVNWLLVITWALIVYEFVLLIQATEWSHVLSLAFLLFCNYYVLFKLMRDRFLLLRSYKEEQVMQ